MKVAFHFNADHPALGCSYGQEVHETLFGALMRKRNINLKTKVFVGDLLLLTCCSVPEIRETGKGYMRMSYSLEPALYDTVFNEWVTSVFKLWNTFDACRLMSAKDNNIYVVCFESIDREHANFIDRALKKYEPYLGATEVYEGFRIHWELYGARLLPFGRLINRDFKRFYEEEDPLEYEIDSLSLLGFDNIGAEKLNYRYTIFDGYHDFEHSRRVSEWKDRCGALLAFIADDTVSSLSDVAPALGDKLWAAVNGLEKAETGEEFAQVMASCRRIFEYVVDAVAPVSDTPTESGHSIKKGQYKNRLFEYAKQCRLSDSEIDMVKVSSEYLYAQWDKLHSLANKGVHSEVFRSEARRCFIRTVLLLDDIVSFKNSSFEIRTEIDEESLRAYLNSFL